MKIGQNMGGRERNYIPLKFCVFDVLKNINYGIVV